MVATLREELWVDGQSFEFKLYRKMQQMGKIGIDQWWMDVRGLYGQRGQLSCNRDVVIDFFWARCRQEGANTDGDAQESWLLAKLVPYARSNSARSVFVDANSTPPTKNKQSMREEATDALETSLRNSRQERSSWSQFGKKGTQAILGPPALEQQAKKLYGVCVDRILTEPRALLEHDEMKAVDLARERWNEMIRKWGRRRGFALEKQVLDVLSYEARTAFHRCYSETWEQLLPHLTEGYELDEPSRRFLIFWHVDQHRDRDPPTNDAFDHLFHGHLFALHPIGGQLLFSPTGRELVGEWLSAPHSEERFERVLHALLITAYQYQDRRSEIAEERRRFGKSEGDAADRSDEEGEAVLRQSRRRRPRHH